MTTTIPATATATVARLLYYNSSNNDGENNDRWWSSFFNQTTTSFNNEVNDLSSNLHPASDVDVNGVLTSAIFNAMVFIVFMLSYEFLRRSFPNVYASKQSKELMLQHLNLQYQYRHGNNHGSIIDDNGDDDNDDNVNDNVNDNKVGNESQSMDIDFEKLQDSLNIDTSHNQHRGDHPMHVSEGQFILGSIQKHTLQFNQKLQQHPQQPPLPSVYQSEVPFGWVKPVFDISWKKVREVGGLDAYFYLRYIKMCFKITSVTALWGIIILFPTYASGENGAVGWYYFSMANVSQGSPIIWVSIVFMYLFSSYVLFVIKQEYKHFVELRLDFLSKGDSSNTIDPQHHYSVMVENIPKELKSDSALFTYFDKLYPGKVHSANIILKVPELEALSQRKLRLTRRLEKSIAYYEATGNRPTHITGRFRTMICGIESNPVELCCDSKQIVSLNEYSYYKKKYSHDHNHNDDFNDNDEDEDDDEDYLYNRKGIRVDSIDYYTHDLFHVNTKMFLLQKEKSEIAAFGNRSLNGSGWFTALSRYADMIFQADLSDGEDDNFKDFDNEQNNNNNNNNEKNHKNSIEGTKSDNYDDDESSNESLNSVGFYNKRASRRGNKKHNKTATTTNNKSRLHVDNFFDQNKFHNEHDPPMYGSLEDRKEDAASHLQSQINRNDSGRSQPQSIRFRSCLVGGGKRNLESTPNRDKPSISSKSSKEEPLLKHQRCPERSRSVNFLEHDEVMLSATFQEDQVSQGLQTNSSAYHTLPKSSTMNSTAKRLSKVADRLGFDFALFILRILSRWLRRRKDIAKGDDIMSSTGFVTFLDLGTVTSVASVQLTHKPNTMKVTVAPEPRDILWENCSSTIGVNERRESYANVSLILGAFLWSIPLASIQALASADQVAKIPGLEWISDFDEGKLKVLINAYLPVLALLAIIMILPLLFEAIAIYYEKRKTLSDVNRSVVSRYFYYQLANIYISVTAGSIWLCASEIIQRPSAGLEILGNSLPTVVGYFISLLVTKILGGLPIVILRVAALGRYLMLRLLHRTKYLTQRELDNVYLVEPLYYGWEYPTQMLVIVICFTYAIISPIILIFGALYFIAALMVYKKQILYVYTPSYESGGDLFPLVCDRTILGLVCGQLTFTGYSIVRGGHFIHVLSALPLVFFTLWTMRYFENHYIKPSKRLTLELAHELDTKIEAVKRNSQNHSVLDSSNDNNTLPEETFDKRYYKQPVMTEKQGQPMFYRIERQDILTKKAREKLGNSRMHMWSATNRNSYHMNEVI